MIKIEFNNKEYNIEKYKLVFVISKCAGRDDIKDDEIFDLMKRYCLYDDYFLSHVNEI